MTSDVWKTRGPRITYCTEKYFITKFEPFVLLGEFAIFPVKIQTSINNELAIYLETIG